MDPTFDYKEAYERLVSDVKKMMEAQQEFFKSKNKGPIERQNALAKAKGWEAKVLKSINPPKSSQATFEFLAQ